MLINKILSFCAVLSLLHSVNLLFANIGLITVPKSGTHLILELMKQIGKETGQKEPLTGNDQKSWCSFWHTRSIPHYILFRPKLFLGVRDPRDVILSTVHWYDYLVSNDAPNFSKQFKFLWTLLSFREKVQFLIRNKEHHVMAELQNMMFLSQAYPHALVIQFEGLVGEEGGGNEARQYQTITTILCALDIDPLSVDIEQIQSNLFGNSPTFRKGQIGQWKEYPYPEDFNDPLITTYLLFLENHSF